MTFISKSKEETLLLGKKIGSLLKPSCVIAMQGELGAGKTVLTKGIALALGIQEDVTSPTFCLASEYQGKMTLYHVDAYRLSGDDDFLDLGAEDFLYGSGVCVIEWADRLKNCLPKDTISISFKIKDNLDRLISIDNWCYEDIEDEDIRQI